jgi:hypothetical protein
MKRNRFMILLPPKSNPETVCDRLCGSVQTQGH